jgi:ADP-heptose:LPS heptosyltransferase
MRLFVEFMPCLGDLVTELPILHAIHAVIRPLDVEVSVDRGEAGLLDDYDWIARRHVRTDRLASRLTPIPSSFRRSFDVLLYLRSNPSIKLTRLFVRAKRKLGPECYDETQSPLGVIPHRYSILRHVLDSPVPDIATRIVLKRERTTAAWAATGLSPGTRFVCVGPGAGEAWRRWPAPRFAELARALRDRFDAVVALGARSDAALVSEVEKGGAVSMIGQPLPVVAALLAEASLYVGTTAASPTSLPPRVVRPSRLVSSPAVTTRPGTAPRSRDESKTSPSTT